jgi:hypothetical protein
MTGLHLTRAIDADTATPQAYLYDILAVNTLGFNATARLTITVTNINDVAPMHTTSIRNLSVVENSPAGTLLAVLSYTDGDSLAEFRVSTWDIVEGNAAGTFAVDENANLVVRNATSLDHEARSSYHLRIRISNDAPPHLFTDAVYIVRRS